MWAALCFLSQATTWGWVDGLLPVVVPTPGSPSFVGAGTLLSFLLNLALTEKYTWTPRSGGGQ